MSDAEENKNEDGTKPPEVTNPPEPRPDPVPAPVAETTHQADTGVDELRELVNGLAAKVDLLLTGGKADETPTKLPWTHRGRK